MFRDASQTPYVKHHHHPLLCPVVFVFRVLISTDIIYVDASTWTWYICACFLSPPIGMSASPERGLSHFVSTVLVHQHFRNERANPHSALHSPSWAHLERRGLSFNLPLRASVTHLCLRNLPFKPSVPSLLLHSLSPEKLYLAWGRAVWLWLITYSPKSIIYASTVCPESFRPEASYAQKSGFETHKAFFPPFKTIVSAESFQKPIL